MGFNFEVNDSTSLYSAYTSKGKQTQKKQQSNSQLNIGEKLLNFSKAKNELAKMLKTAEQHKAERIKQRNSMKASNGLTWKQTQDKIKMYREKYLPKSNIPVFFADSPYKDYVYVKQKGGIARFYVDERKYILDHMSPKEREDFEKTMAAYDELYPQTREKSPNGDNFTNVKYPEEQYIAPKEPPEGYNKMYA